MEWISRFFRIFAYYIQPKVVRRLARTSRRARLAGRTSASRADAAQLTRPKPPEPDSRCARAIRLRPGRIARRVLLDTVPAGRGYTLRALRRSLPPPGGPVRQ